MPPRREPPSQEPPSHQPQGGRAPSVRRQLALLLGLAAAPALLLAVAFGARSYALETARAERLLTRETAAEARELRDLLVGARATLRTLAAGADLADLDSPRCRRALSAAVARDPAFALAVAVDAGSRVRCASAPGARRLVFGFGGDLRPLMAGAGPRLDFVRLSAPDGGAAAGAAASLPLPGPDGPRGVVALFAPVADLRASAARGPGRPAELPPARTALVDSSGMVMLDAPAARRGWLPAATDLLGLLAAEPGLARATAADGSDWVYAAAPLWQGRAWLLSGAPRQALHAPALSRAAAPILAPGLMLLVAVSMAYFGLNRLVVRHLDHLARLTRAYGRGRLALRPRGLERAPREIAGLAEDMARMAGRLADRERSLRAAAESNRFLLREVHHRVKNNLQMIVSLLNLQMGRSRAGPEREALERIRARVLAVASVHGAVYDAETLERVPLAPLIERLARPLAELAPPDRRPRLELDLADLEETPERATPFALLVNEAVTNAVKHAGARDPDGPVIRVSLQARPEGGLRLLVVNDVAPADKPEERAEGAGAEAQVGGRLIAGFARQLAAALEQGEAEGRYRLSLDVPPPPDSPPDAPAGGA